MTTTTLILIGVGGFILGLVVFGYQELKKNPLKKIEEEPPPSPAMPASQANRPDAATSTPKQLKITS